MDGALGAGQQTGADLHAAGPQRQRCGQTAPVSNAARDSDTIVTGRIGGTPVRVLKNRMSREYVRQEKAGADKMALERFTLGSLRKAVFDGDTENGSLMAGQAAGLLHEVRPVEEIFAAMVSEAKTCITGLYKETI